MKMNPKHLVLRLLYSRRWPRSRPLEEGYAILLPSPMDMPFLLRFALEGLRHIDTQNCKQILVVPDAWGTDGGRALRQVVDEFDDPRIAMAQPQPIDYGLLRTLKGVNSAHTGCSASTARRTCGVNMPSCTTRTPSTRSPMDWSVRIGNAAAGKCTPWA